MNVCNGGMIKLTMVTQVYYLVTKLSGHTEWSYFCSKVHIHCLKISREYLESSKTDLNLLKKKNYVTKKKKSTYIYVLIYGDIYTVTNGFYKN